MSTIRAEKKRKNFAQISNDLLQDHRLSYEARGVICYLLSKPDDWECRVQDLMKANKAGRDKVRNILRELESFGYAELITNRGEDGKVLGKTWVIYEEARKTENPSVGETHRKPEKPTVGKHRRREKPTVGKSGHIIIQNNTNTDKENKKERENAPPEKINSIPEVKEQEVEVSAPPQHEFDPVAFIVDTINTAPATTKELWQARYNVNGELSQVSREYALWYIGKHFEGIPENQIKSRIKNTGRTAFISNFESSWLKNLKRINESAKRTNRAKSVRSHSGRTASDYGESW